MGKEIVVRGRTWRVEIRGDDVQIFESEIGLIHVVNGIEDAARLIAILEGNVQYWKKKHDELATFLSDTAEPLDGCTN